jgi:hypothetical protein
MSEGHETHRHSWMPVDVALNRYRCRCGAEGYRIGNVFRVRKPKKVRA